MQFDFDKFSMVAASVYPQSSPYSLEEALSVFQYYFQRYEDFTGHPHPPIKAIQIARICRDMPYLSQEDRGDNTEDISPEVYPLMIEKHFTVKYRHCDYNINHFFSGRVRELRFFEVVF